MRVGRIGYSNCYPVYGAMDRGVTPLAAELVTGTPSELNDLLAAGELDLSVVSAVEYARNARDYVLLPDLAISFGGRSGSWMIGPCCSRPRRGRRSACWSSCVATSGTCGRAWPGFGRRRPISTGWRICRTRPCW